MLYSSSCIHILAPFRTDRCNTTPHKCLQAHTILRLNDLVTQHLTHVIMFIIACCPLNWAWAACDSNKTSLAEFCKELLFADLKKRFFFLVNYYFGQREAGVKREVITSNYKKSKKKCLSNMLDCVTVLCRHLYKCVTSVRDLSSISTISQTTWRLCVIAISSLFTKPDLLLALLSILTPKERTFSKGNPENLILLKTQEFNFGPGFVFSSCKPISGNIFISNVFLGL